MTYHIAATLGLLALTSCSMAQHTKSRASDLREAFLHHQKLEFPEVKATYGQSGGESFIMSERWKNYKLYSVQCPTIAEVVRVTVSKTIQKDEYVITMYGPHAGEDKDGNQTDMCSLWTVGAEENKLHDVRAFTPY